MCTFQIFLILLRISSVRNVHFDKYLPMSNEAMELISCATTIPINGARAVCYIYDMLVSQPVLILAGLIHGASLVSELGSYVTYVIF